MTRIAEDDGPRAHPLRRRRDDPMAIESIARPRGFRPAVAALAALAGLDALAPHFPQPGYPLQVAGLAAVSFPLAAAAVLALYRPRGAWVWVAVAAVAGLCSAVFVLTGYPGTLATVAKLLCAAALGFLIATVVEKPVELVAVALAVAVSDVLSVARGPSRAIFEHHEGLFNALSLQLHPVGSDVCATLGMTDILFFAAFLGAVARLQLRVGRSWIAMTASLAATSVITAATHLLVPALPLLAIAAVGANADHILRSGTRAQGF